MATTSKINLRDGSTVEMTRKEGVPDAIWNDVVKFVKENEKAVKKNPAIVKLLSEHPEQIPVLMNFTNDADSIKNFLQSQVLASNVSQDDQQEKIKALQEDKEFKPMFDDIKANGPDVLMKYLGDEALMRKLSQKLGGITPEIMKQLTAINECSVPSAVLRKGGGGPSIPVSQYPSANRQANFLRARSRLYRSRFLQVHSTY